MPLVQEGDLAPDFTATAHTGETITLAGYRGKHVVLWFYPKADTPGCTIEGKGFRDYIQELEKAGAAVLGVSFDTLEENRAFAEKFSFPFPLLCDTKRELGMAYGAADSPEATNARRISYLIGPDGKVVRAYDQVDPQKHPAQVIEDLAARAQG